MTSSDRSTVLAVDDEPEYLEVYSTWLRGDFDVLTATNGRDALELLDEGVDVLLLDRLMPGSSGDEILDEVRSRGLDTRVAMLTAVQPELDIIDMPFDDYLVKPVTRDELVAVVETLLTRSKLDVSVQECFSLASKKVALETRMDPAWLAEHPEYVELEERLGEAKRNADTAVDELLDAGRPESAYLDI